MNRLPARGVACCLGRSIRVHRIAFSKADTRREAAGTRASISLVERCLADSGPDLDYCDGDHCKRGGHIGRAEKPGPCTRRMTTVYGSVDALAIIRLRSQATP